ncbi:MAG: c-type cytochrome [Acidobacteriota bacterium]|nr:c-type cytochrome [Blastocatellia bacterium]MDW8239102.1 c-type cytochrome [Acidobacteriota bacterium]
MRVALAISSFVALIIHGIVFYDQFFHQWEDHQTAYFEQARGLATKDAERAALEGRRPRIEQIIVTQFGEARVDRCTTCHIAIDDPRFKAHAEPLRTHPNSEALGDTFVNGRWERRHKFSDFGCTVCHDGQGRGLETFYAHGEDHFWPEPLLGYTTQETWRAEFKPKLLGKEFMQANCAQCHTEENFKSTPLVSRGRQLFFEKNCYGCHRIEGMSTGTLGPDLTEVGKKFKLDYLWESIVEPRANSAVSSMPKFNLSDEDVKSLVVFLKSRRGMNFAETSLERYRARIRESKVEPATQPTTEVAGVSAAARGERLINERACAACHKIGDRDGGIAPDLSFEGLLRDESWLMDHFRDPRSRVPDSIMPAFGFSDSEFLSMTQYLKSLTTPPPTATPAEAYKNLCARCHGEKGDGHGLIALYLDPYPRDLTKVAFMNSKPEERFIMSIKEGVPGTSMPAWGKVLNDAQIRDLLNYIWQTFVREPRRELKARNVPAHNPVAMSGESVARGERIYLQRCTGCHGRKADGKGPNSLDILPRPRNLRNRDFINSVSDRRLFDAIMYGVQGTAMPPWIDYGLSQNDVGDLVNYLRSLNQTN